MLHNHLEAHLDEELCARLKHNKVCKDKVLKTWINSICLINKAHAVETKWHHELIKETLNCQAKCQNTKNDTLHGPSHHGNNTQTTGSSSSTSYVKLPPLLDAEQTLLNEHDSCTKCCRFYVDHRSQNCPDSFPSGKTYKTVTLTDALTAKKAKATAKPSKSTTTKPVTATSSATIEAVDSNEDISATAAILPDSPGKYTSDSDEDWDVSRCEVSHTPLCSKHLIWNCQIHSQTDDFPVKMRALLDNGAHLVLIQPDLVDRLGLKQYRLHVPEVINVTFSKEKNKTELYFYVKLSLSSLDCTWTSHAMKAIVTPGLCLPVILGLPWLEKNFIVTDHAAQTCIDKRNSYDLLNPPVIVPPPPPKPRMREQIKATKVDKKLVLTELMVVCHDRLRNTKLKPEEVKEFNVAGAICDCLEILVAQEQLKAWEKKLKNEYKEIFELIPHANELPCDVVAEIHIKDAEKTIKSRSYPSPRKYKEAWQILIKQHLDASRIHPSSSPCAPPAFIVPKANPNVLPWWVNDYWQLNENTVTDSHPLPHINDILNDCAKGKIWGTIDMTNSFF